MWSWGRKGCENFHKHSGLGKELCVLGKQTFQPVWKCKGREVRIERIDPPSVFRCCIGVRETEWFRKEKFIWAHGARDWQVQEPDALGET